MLMPQSLELKAQREPSALEVRGKTYLFCTPHIFEFEGY